MPLPDAILGFGGLEPRTGQDSVKVTLAHSRRTRHFSHCPWHSPGLTANCRKRPEVLDEFDKLGVGKFFTQRIVLTLARLAIVLTKPHILLAGLTLRISTPREKYESNRHKNGALCHVDDTICCFIRVNLSRDGPP